MWFRRARTIRATCFGKLPAFPDFVEPTHDPGFSPHVRELVIDAVEQRDLDAAPPARDDLSRAARRLLFSVPPDRVVAATLWPSLDSTGREFPFLVYTEFPAKWICVKGTMARVAPGPLGRLWHALESTARTPGDRPWTELGSSDLDIDEVTFPLSEAAWEIDPKELAEDAADGSIRTIDRTVLEESPSEDASLVPTRLWCAAFVAEKVIGEREPASIVLPAGPGTQSQSSVAAWLAWIRLVAGDPIERPTLLVEPNLDAEGHACERLTISLRPLDAADLRATLGWSKPESGGLVYDLRRPARPESSDAYERFETEVSAVSDAAVDLEAWATLTRSAMA